MERSLNYKLHLHVVSLGLAKSMIVDAVKIRDEGGFGKLCGPLSKVRGKQSNAISPRWFESDLSDDVKESALQTLQEKFMSV